MPWNELPAGNVVEGVAAEHVLDVVSLRKPGTYGTPHLLNPTPVRVRGFEDQLGGLSCSFACSFASYFASSIAAAVWAVTAVPAAA